MTMDRILFGTAGVPNATEKKNSPVDGVKKIHELELDCMQLEFAHGVRMKEEVSSNLRKISYELRCSANITWPILHKPQRKRARQN